MKRKNTDKKTKAEMKKKKKKQKEKKTRKKENNNNNNNNNNNTMVALRSHQIGATLISVSAVPKHKLFRFLTRTLTKIDSFNNNT